MMMTMPEQYSDVQNAERVMSLIDKLARPTFVLRFAWRMCGKQKGASTRALNASREIEQIVHQWVTDHPVAPDGFHVVGDNAADGDSVHLFCLRCPEPDRPDWMDGMTSNGLHLGKFPTMKWDDPPAIATLRDLFTAAREHDVEVHGV